MDPADNTRAGKIAAPVRVRQNRQISYKCREGRILEHGRPEQGDRLVKERVQVGRGRAHTAAVR